MRRLCATLVFMVVVCLSAASQDIYARYNGSCQQGGSPATTNGIDSSQKVQLSFPACTITVFNHGGVILSSLFSDAAGAFPLPNPFTATSTGSFGFYAANGRYDALLSGAGILSPFTISDITLCFNCTGGGGGGNPGGANFELQTNVGGTTFGGVTNAAKGSVLASAGTGAFPVFQTKISFEARDNMVCDGVTDDTTALTTFLTAIGSSTPARLVFSSGQCLLSTISIPGNVALDATLGGGIKVATGQTVTIKGPILTPPQQMFFNIGPGQGSLSFIGNTGLTTVSPLWFGIDCFGVVDNSPVWQQIVSFLVEDVTFVLPMGCTDNHASQVTLTPRSGFHLKSEDRTQNGGGNRRPIEQWTGTTGGMWYLRSAQAPTIEGFQFINIGAGAHLDYYIRLDKEVGDSGRIGTEAMFRYNTFTNNLLNPGTFSAIQINTVSGVNHEKNVITDNDFVCSQGRAARESDSGSISIGSTTLTCGLLNCSFIADAHIADRVRVSYATGILDTTVASITDNNHLEMVAPSGVNQTLARITFREAFGNGITIGSVNSKHNTVDRNSFTQCARGLNIVNGSLSGAHFGGSNNDVLVYINDVSEPTELSYLEDESAMRDVHVSGQLDAPLTLSHMRNSELAQGESDGFIYFNNGGRVVITGSTVQDTPQANSVLIRANSPSTLFLTSIGNQWGPGVESMATLGFSTWRTAAEAATLNNSIFVSCGDSSLSDAPGGCYQFGEGGTAYNEGHLIAGSGRFGNFPSFATFTAEPNVQVNTFVNEAIGYKSIFNGFNNSATMKFVGFDAAWKVSTSGTGNGVGFRYTLPTVTGSAQTFERGLWVAAPTGNTHITTASGVYVEDLASVTGITNKYSFFGVGATDIAHFGGPVETAGQITSTVSTGTAPLVIASTTNVPNLNASSLSGATFAAPGAIGGGTPAAGAFTTINATGQTTSTLATGTAPFSITSTTPVVNLTTVPTTYDHSGTQQTATHLVQDSCTLGTDCGVTLTGSAVYTNSTSYTCVCEDDTAINACQVNQTSGSAFTITGTGTDAIRYVCVGN